MTYELLLQTGSATATIFFLLLTAQMYSRMLSLSGLPEYLTRQMVGADVPSMAIVLFFVIIIMLILGTILDSTSIMLLTMPIMVPVALKLGYDNLWFGMVSILAIELGQLTPPCGMMVFAMKAAMPTETTIDEIFSASRPFLVVQDERGKLLGTEHALAEPCRPVAAHVALEERGSAVRVGDEALPGSQAHQDRPVVVEPDDRRPAVQAEPLRVRVAPRASALVIIDMQSRSGCVQARFPEKIFADATLSSYPYIGE